MRWKLPTLMMLFVIALLAWLAPQPQAVADITASRAIVAPTGLGDVALNGDDDGDDDDDGDCDERCFANKVAGVWTTGDYTIPGGPDVFSPITVNADGTYEANTTIDQGSNGLNAVYGNYMGYWEQIGPSSMATKIYNFGFNSNGELLLTVQYDEVWTLNDSFTSAEVETYVGWWLTPVDLTDPPPMDGSFGPVPSTVNKWILDPPAPVASGHHGGDDDLIEQIAGVWWGGPDDGFFGWLAATYNADGTVEEASTADFTTIGVELFAWSNGRGPIVQTGPNTAYSEFLILGFEYLSGVWTWTVRGVQEYTFNEARTELSVHQVNNLYLPSQDPFNELPLFSIDYGTSTSHKWIVEPPAPAPVASPIEGLQRAEEGEVDVMYTGHGHGNGGGWRNKLIKKLAGLWYSPSLFGTGQLLLIINEDGTFEANSTLDQGIFNNLLFSNTRGVIVQTGKWTAFDNGIIFAFEGGTPDHVQTTRGNAYFTFAPNLKSGTVRQFNDVFCFEGTCPPSVMPVPYDTNPFDPASQPSYTTPETVYPIYRLSPK